MRVQRGKVPICGVENPLAPYRCCFSQRSKGDFRHPLYFQGKRERQVFRTLNTQKKILGTNHFGSAVAKLIPFPPTPLLFREDHSCHWRIPFIHSTAAKKKSKDKRRESETLAPNWRSDLSPNTTIIFKTRKRVNDIGVITVLPRVVLPWSIK